ncbi:MAG: Arc family DNA-binding protein [Thermoanaerobaculales bacterium]
MAGLMIRELPDELHERLKERARVHRRSLSKEAIVILEEALGDRAGARLLEQCKGVAISIEDFTTGKD